MNSIDQVIAYLSSLPAEPQQPAWMEEATRHMEEQQVVQAIKAIRASTGWGLKQSKYVADFYRDNGYWDVQAVTQQLYQAASDETVRCITDLVDLKRTNSELKAKLQNQAALIDNYQADLGYQSRVSYLKSEVARLDVTLRAEQSRNELLRAKSRAAFNALKDYYQ